MYTKLEYSTFQLQLPVGIKSESHHTFLFYAKYFKVEYLSEVLVTGNFLRPDKPLHQRNNPNQTKSN